MRLDYELLRRPEADILKYHEYIPNFTVAHVNNCLNITILT